MRILAVLAHPWPESFAHAILGAVRDGAERGGHPVRVIDLHAEGFVPTMSADELKDYADPDRLPDDLRPHVEALAWAEGVVCVYPTWWGGPPAMLKGWLDRAFRPGLAFDAKNGIAMKPLLKQVRLMAEITATGAPRWIDAVTNTAGRRILFRSMRTSTGLRTRTMRLALHGIDGATDAQRKAFLDRVSKKVAALR